MNKRQKIVQQQFINNEEGVIKQLKQVYGESQKHLEGVAQKLQDDIDSLDARIALTDDEEEKKVLRSQVQSKVYQKKYQDSLKKQVDGILDKMQATEFKTVDEYLNKCYEEGFVGTMYDLQGQGIPMCFPLDQESMVTAVQLDSKISHGLYTRLGEDVSLLKKKITAQVSRGIATGMTFGQIANQLSGYTRIGYNNAIRIARTEGHRIQVQSTMDACHEAKNKGANVVKQWDSTLDAKTRDSHVAVDGEIRELEEPFSNGLMFPGDPDGGAAEVINCRCALLQRARWALQGGFTKMNNFTKQLESFDSPESYSDFKKAFFSKENKQYMNYVGEMEEKYGTKNFEKVLNKMNDREYNHYSKLLDKNPVFNKNVLTNNGKSDKMSSGAKYGAYNDKNDPFNKKRKQHANLYYEEIRNSNTKSFVNAVSKNANIDVKTVTKAYKHIFEDNHNFEPDYDMAESFRRLRTNDHIQEHDKVLIHHEALEHDIMAENPHMSYEEAHRMTEQSYNYAEALFAWLRKGGK